MLGDIGYRHLKSIEYESAEYHNKIPIYLRGTIYWCVMGP